MAKVPFTESESEIVAVSVFLLTLMEGFEGEIEGDFEGDKLIVMVLLGVAVIVIVSRRVSDDVNVFPVGVTRVETLTDLVILILGL